MDRLRVSLIAWLTAGVIYFLLLVIYADWPPAAAAGVAAISVGVATLCGIPVWWATGRLTWPARWPTAFFAAHLTLAVVFSIAWLGLDVGLTHWLLAAGAGTRGVRAACGHGPGDRVRDVGDGSQTAGADHAPVRTLSLPTCCQPVRSDGGSRGIHRPTACA